MAQLFVKKGDTVVVRSGKDRGARGKVLVTLPTKGRVLVEGVNRVKKHTKVQQAQRGGTTGGIVTQEAPIHISNVMLLDSDGKPTRVAFRRDDETGKKVRVAKTNGKDI
jgi:large subunit ribosomal protein L24